MAGAKVLLQTYKFTDFLFLLLFGNVTSHALPFVLEGTNFIFALSRYEYFLVKSIMYGRGKTVNSGEKQQGTCSSLRSKYSRDRRKNKPLCNS